MKAAEIRALSVDEIRSEIETARENLFNAFRGSVRPGGTGLGLAIADELARAHGGELRHVDSPRGAVFHVIVPDRVTDLASMRRGTLAGE